VVATSVADPTKHATATVTVTAATGGLAAQLAVLSRKSIFFAHQSVGENILAGIQVLLDSNGGAEPTILAEYTTPSGKGAGQIAQMHIGQNGDPVGKINDFVAKMDMPGVAWGYGTLSDIAVLKFCWVDWAGPATPAQVFSAYQAAVATLRSRFPTVTIVHVTTPLYVNNYAPGQGTNVTRQQYNALLRGAYASEPLFDIALLESTSSSGARVYDADGAPALAPEWAQPDGGHLNTAGQDRMARAFIALLAGLP
jgi:hypothetical protein